jgi:PPOX class probable F420-dependent enzyme
MSLVPDSHRDLLDAEVASLSTIGDDGFPQVTAVWFLLDEDGKLKLSLNTTRLKMKNLQKRPECALFVLDRENPYRYVSIRARAAIEPDDDYEFADRVGRKYGGADLRAMDGPGEARVMVTLEPVGVLAVQMG